MIQWKLVNKTHTKMRFSRRQRRRKKNPNQKQCHGENAEWILNFRFYDFANSHLVAFFVYYFDAIGFSISPGSERKRVRVSEIDLVTLDVPLSFHLDFAILSSAQNVERFFEIKVIFRDATNTRTLFAFFFAIAHTKGLIHIVVWI